MVTAARATARPDDTGEASGARSATTKQEAKMKLGRAAAAGLALVAATALAGPGWGQEKEQEKEQKQEQSQQRQERGLKQKADREQRLKQKDETRRERGQPKADRGPAARAVKKIGRELHLSREQRQSLRELVRLQAETLRGAARDVGEARRALRERAVADPLDEAAIRGASEKLGAAIGSAAVLTARLAGEIRPALTPDQRDRLKKLSARWEKRRERWRERIERWDGD
jgi:Spy/CpxP family protein refolding chaperone